LLLAGMCVHYESVRQQYNPYPTQGQLADNYAEYMGDEYYEWKTIVETRPEAMFFTVKSETSEIRVSVPEKPTGVTEGDVVQIYGTIEPDRRVSPTQLVVSERTRLNYLYLVSAIGVAVTALVGRQRWRINFSKLTIEPRHEDSDA
jgi:hypothetical protein